MKLSWCALVVCAVASTACVGAWKPAEVPVAPPTADDGVFQDGVWKRDEAPPLYTRSWAPAAGAELRGVLVIVHGLRDHGDRYRGLARRLVAAGFAVHAADLRGHGRSWGNRVWITDFADYVDDLEAYVAKVRVERPGAPIFLLGHSMGGTIVTRYVEERKPDVAGVVLSAPALGLHDHPLLASLLRANGRGYPLSRLPLLLLDNDDFSRDRAVVQEMDRDPLISSAGPATTGAELLGAIGAAWRDAAAVAAPLLVLHGTGDKVTAPDASRDFLERVSSQDRTLQLYEGFWHDLLHEPGGERVAADIEAWLVGKVAGVMPSLSASAAPATVDRPFASTGGLSVGGLLSQPVEDGHEVDLGVVGHARFSVGRTLGWYGGVSLWQLEEEDLRASIYPVGLGIRLGDEGLLGIAGGIAGFERLSVPVEASLELPVGPIDLIGGTEVRWLFDDGDRVRELSARLGLRLPGASPYWQRVALGSGLYLAGTFRRVLDENYVGVELGLHVWGTR
jgi:acylglycerol lipase